MYRNVFKKKFDLKKQLMWRVFQGLNPVSLGAGDQKYLFLKFFCGKK
jgi:hypothetical protein